MLAQVQQKVDTESTWECGAKRRAGMRERAGGPSDKPIEEAGAAPYT
jgi:hypothetical protein